MTREEVITLVQDSDLNETVKTTLIKRVTEEGLTQDVLDTLKEALQMEIDKGFDALGIDISDTPEYKEKEATMVKEVEAAKADFDTAIVDIDQQTKTLQQQTSKALDELEAEIVREQN
ncbi:MAG: hypothetical protein A2017_16910 [Lentisphaerae bacterium GWF2_44_16]|nr:MAG: hypothetical protein A2017_16910 [Lentisphaerae bacterium GWF2_44_16]